MSNCLYGYQQQSERNEAELTVLYSLITSPFKGFAMSQTNVADRVSGIKERKDGSVKGNKQQPESLTF